MALRTDLSRSPYYDDFNNDKNFYRVLYRPGVAVQTRELNQMQTILQDQIDKFGRHIFTEGSVIEGCAFTFDKDYDYVKLLDTYANGTTFTVSDFVGKYVYNTNQLTAIIVNTETGYIAQDPNLNTLYIKYQGVGTYPNSSLQNAFTNNEILTISANANISNTTAIVGTVTVATVSNSTGKGYAFTTTGGTIFQKGFFVNVKPQTLIVSKYSNVPDNISVGFDSIENIVTPEADTSLLDNAAGAPNYSAPGAHRLQLVPTLIATTTTEIAGNNAFFSLVDFKNGVPVSIKNTAEYASLGKELARRTYETNGNYIVSPFLLSTGAKRTDDANYHDYVNLIVSRGVGYVEGYRVEYVNNNRVNLRKGTDTDTVFKQNVSANYGNYVYVKEYCGDFDSERVSVVELHNVAKTAVSGLEFLGVGYGSETKIGQAVVKSIAYDSGVIGTKDALYKLYLFNIVMDDGQNFANVRSVIRNNSGDPAAVADVVLTYNATLSDSIASVQEPLLDTLIFPLGQAAIKPDGITNIQYVYKNKTAASIQTNGLMTAGLPSVVGPGTESYNVSGDVLSRSEVENIIVIPTANSYALKTNTVAGTTGTKLITGTSTNFDTEYRSGDLIRINGELHTINFVTNATSLTLKENLASSPAANVHYKAFISGIPIDFTQPGRSIGVSGSTMSFNLNETLGSTLATVIYSDVIKKNTVSIKKEIVKNAIVKINCRTHTNGNTGLWWLGLSDIHKINGIYISDTVDTYANSTTAADSSSYFSFNNGQTENSYGYGSIRLRNNATNILTTNSTMLIDLDVFTHDRSQGVGFFTANSYPIDDINTSNALAISTAEIPSMLTRKNITYDLRDCIDYRPFVINSAEVTQDASAATENPQILRKFDILAAGSYFPAPDSNWQGDVVHYLPRKDLAVIDTKGQLKIVEGVSGDLPIPPLKPTGTMALGVLTIPAYPSLTPNQAKELNKYNYAITVNVTQNRRYTMADIGTLSKRIDNLEYYTSLNLLEQSTASMLVKNDETGLDRFKNGILVDPFAGHDIGDTLDPNYAISISGGELRPRFSQRQEVFDFDPDLSLNTVQVGPMVLLDYNQVSWIDQKYASKVRNCIEGNIFVFKTSITLDPNYNLSPDLKKSADVISDTLDLSANWINLQKAWGTQWGNWTTIDTKSTPAVGAKTETSKQTDAQGNVYKTYNQKTVTTTTTKQTQTGTILDISDPAINDIKIGEFVTNVTTLHYIQSITIKFNASGMKPGARVWAYFNNIDVTHWCVTTDLYFNIAAGTDYDTPLFVNSDGTIRGFFTIPPNRFQATELTFMLCDVDNLTTKYNAITTQGIGTFYADKLSLAKGTAKLRTRDVVLSSHETQQEQEIKSYVIDNNVTLEVEQGPPIIPVINIYNDNRVTNNITNNYQTTVNQTTVVNDNGTTTTYPVGDSTVGSWQGGDGDDDCACDGEDDDDDDDDDGDDDDGDE